MGLPAKIKPLLNIILVEQQQISVSGGTPARDAVFHVDDKLVLWNTDGKVTTLGKVPRNV
jgi:hypothetical protein